MFNNIKISNPKINKHSGVNLSYYAGYNSNFVNNIIKSIELPRDAKILDPWNGVGTTTTISTENGIESIGVDLNPIMIICAKASLISKTDYDSLKSLTEDIVLKFNKSSKNTLDNNDPLLSWISPQSLSAIRDLNTIINQLLVDSSSGSKLNSYENMSNYASYFYLCAFRTLRILTSNFKSSNPTWIKKPKNLRTRIRPSRERVISLFEAVSQNILQLHKQNSNIFNSNLVQLKVANSANTGISNNSVDMILTSPPYCTRIDYAISTQVELSFLYFDSRKLKELRNEMIGTSTINKLDYTLKKEFGEKTNTFLSRLQKHESKASATYYYKSHFQYYNSMFNSLNHLTQDILKDGGGMIVVIQDSYYKEIHNDLQSNLTDMGSSIGLRLIRREDFQTAKSFAMLNPKSKKYKSQVKPIESVLCFQKI